MPKIHQKSKSQLAITIPSEILLAFGWEEGDILLFSKPPGENHVTIEKINGEKNA